MNSSGDIKDWRPAHSPWLVSLSVMLAMAMAMLDSSVANVSLPHIAGSLSVSTDLATWVLTSYIVSSAIVLAATGWLSSYFGRKKYLMFSVGLFIVSSMFCGIAQSLPQLIAARVLQGLAGGALQPLAQAIMLESFPKEKRGSAMAGLGGGMIVIPIIGPTLGGWITDNFSWRWIFYINVPVGILGLLMQHMFIEDPPYFVSSKGRSIDYTGLILMILSIGTLQIVLDKGQELDWFGSPWICWGSALVLITLPLFVLWELRRKEPFIKLSLLKDKNLAVSVLMMTLLSVCMFSAMSMLSIFMQGLLGYSALQSGLAMMPRGFGSLIAMALVGKLSDKIDNRITLGVGFFLTALSCFMFTKLNAGVSVSDIALPQFINGFGISLLFVPAAVLGFASLGREDINQGTVISGLLRNLGGSIGISIMFAYQARMAQAHQAYLVANVSGFSHVFRQWAASLHGLGASYSLTLAAAYNKVLQQAAVLAFSDSFRCLALISALCIPLVLLLRAERKDESAKSGTVR